MNELKILLLCIIKYANKFHHYMYLISNFSKIVPNKRINSHNKYSVTGNFQNY